MKMAGTKIDFVQDSVSMFGEKQNIKVTKSGHYAVPLNESTRILADVEARSNVKISLFSSVEDKKKMAEKLHFQFGHPPKGKLIKLLERAGRGSDEELIRKIKEISKNCKTCKTYAKPCPRPVVGFSHASKFNETIAMDLKFF